MSSLGIMWLVHNRTGSYAVAGLVTGRFAVSEALSGPQLARLIDRFGQAPVLPPVLLAHATAVVTLLTLLESGSPHGLMTARVPQGLPPRQRCPGARWTRTAHRGASRSLRRPPSRWPSPAAVRARALRARRIGSGLTPRPPTRSSQLNGEVRGPRPRAPHLPSPRAHPVQPAGIQRYLTSGSFSSLRLPSSNPTEVNPCRS